ncbi:MAG: DUF177 domain-containing protein [Bacteroidetes bacterium]|nr:DUF177 domain-containing protein [Bacteroidota bacterium]
MKYLKQYCVPIRELKQEGSSFDLFVDEKFFEQFENSDIKKGNVNVNIILTKTAQNIILSFNIVGSVNVICDRCLDYFDLPIKIKEKLVFVFSDENKSLSDDFITLNKDKNEINVAQYIYEFITLSLPIKKTHPNDEFGNSTCNKKMLEKLKVYTQKKETQIDPRWNKLKNLIK